MREHSLSFAALLLLVLVYSCNRNTPEPAKPVTVGGLKLQQENGTDCGIADTLDRVDCARLDLHWPVVEQGNDALKKGVEQWATRYLDGLLGQLPDGRAANAVGIEAAAKAFFDEHQKTEKSVMTGGWTAESAFQTLLNDGRYLTLEITGYSYQSGAHGNHTAAVATFDALTGRQLGWDDLVTDKAAVKVLAELVFRESRADLFRPTDGNDPYTFDGVTPFELAQNFGLAPEGIYCHYIPYEVGPYVIGSTQMTIPFAALGNLAKIRPPVIPQSAPATVALDSSLQFDFPHFGSFSLSSWQKTPSTVEKKGGSVVKTAIYKKDGATLKIDSVQTSSGYNIHHTLTGSDGVVERTRSLAFSTRPNKVTETVYDYSEVPAKKYTRSQALSGDYRKLSTLPAMAAGGQWKETVADAPAKLQPAIAPKEDGIKQSPAKGSTPKPAAWATPTVTVTLKQNGNMLIDGKAAGDLESLRKALQAHLLTYNTLPTKVNLKTVGQTGMGMRAEVNTIIKESIDGAKWIRKKTAIAALNAAVGKKLGMATQLEPGTYKASGSFAYISARPTQTGGRAIDYSLTDYAQDRNAPWFSDNAIGLLQYEKGAWKVLAYTIGVRQAPVSTWVKKYKAPRGILGE